MVSYAGNHLLALWVSRLTVTESGSGSGSIGNNHNKRGLYEGSSSGKARC